jgi:hypothetical protein
LKQQRKRKCKPKTKKRNSFLPTRKTENRKQERKEKEKSKTFSGLLQLQQQQIVKQRAL